MAYVLSVLRLDWRIRHLKRQGRALATPDIFRPFDGFRGLIWLITGRYSELDDDIVTRWSRIARVLLFVSFPMILGLFVTAAAGFISRP
jgi:hypothetical protein